MPFFSYRDARLVFLIGCSFDVFCLLRCLYRYGKKHFSDNMSDCYKYTYMYLVCFCRRYLAQGVSSISSSSSKLYCVDYVQVHLLFLPSLNDEAL